MATLASFLFLTAFLGGSVFSGASAQGESLPPPAAASGPDSAEPLPVCSEAEPFPAPGSLEADLLSVLGAIREKSPDLYGRISNMPRTELLRNILRAMESGVELSEKPLESAPPENKVKIWTGRLLENKRILYLRLDALTEETFDSFQNECFSAAYHSPCAVVLDLRSASGRSRASFQLVPRFLSLFSTLVPADRLRTEYFRTRPVAVLTGLATEGAPALFAACLAREKKTVTAGQTVRKSIFPDVCAETGEYFLRIPVVPENVDVSVFLPEPMIPSASVPVRYESIGEPAAVSADRTLRSAIDLLLALSVLDVFDRSPGKN